MKETAATLWVLLYEFISKVPYVPYKREMLYDSPVEMVSGFPGIRLSTEPLSGDDAIR